MYNELSENPLVDENKKKNRCAWFLKCDKYFQLTSKFLFFYFSFAFFINVYYYSEGHLYKVFTTTHLELVFGIVIFFDYNNC